MRKIVSILICLALVVGCTAAFTSCGDTTREVDMSLRSDTLYGLYWYGKDATDSMRSQENMPTEYYDPSKPTVIYSHGWKMSNEEKETMTTLAKTVSKTGGASGEIDYVVEFKALGYNVAFWDWHAYAQLLPYLQNEIWVVKDAEALSENEKTKYKNYYDALVALDGRSFAGELVRSLNAVMKEAEDKEVVFIGHSFGGQMVTAAAYTIYKLADEGLLSNNNIVPDRVILADPYMTGAEVFGQMDLLDETIEETPTALKAAEAFEYINSKGAVIDLYGAMKTMTYDAYKGMFAAPKELQSVIEQKIKENTVYVVQTALTDAYNTVGDVHVVSRDHVLTSYIEGKKGNMDGCVPRTSMTADEMRQYVGREFSLIGNGFDIAGASMQEIVENP